MRVFKALIISLLVYALFIWIFVTYFSKIKKPSPKGNNHVIKIDIKNMPLPVKPAVSKVKAKPKKKILPKKVVKKKPKKKKIIKKKPVKKKVVKKKIVKKKPKKKKIIKKKPVKNKSVKKKIVVKKTPSKKKIYVPKKVTKKKKPIRKKKVIKKSKELEAFENEMVYIDEAMLLPQKVAPSPVSPWSYPNNKIRKLYGAGFHQFTPIQKKFIENNLETIQEITQRTLTRRGYPEGAGRTGQQGTNVVSFNLHPNGDISDLRLKTRIGYRALDDNTLSLIRVAYMDYPYPSTTTKIIFYVKYSIYGY